MRVLPLLLLIPALAAGAAALAQAPAKAPSTKGKIQCWTNDAGLRECGNVVPPQYAKVEREVIDSSGRVRATTARQKTAEEVAAEQAAAKKAVEDKRRAEEQGRYDKFLLDTYPTLKDLEKARDDRIVLLDGQIQLSEKALADGEVSLKQLNERAGKQRGDGRNVDKKLAKQIADYDKGLSDNRRALASLKAKREEIMATFGKDIARYKVIAPPAALATAAPPKKS
jgi:hypothetical protein